MTAIVSEFSKALNREIRYVDVPQDEWEQTDLKQQNLPAHIENHFKIMSKLHHDNRYDRLTHDVENVTGVKPMAVEDWVRSNIQKFQEKK